MSFDDLLKDLQGQKDVQEDPNNISLSKLFNDSFMRKHTRHQSFDEFNEKGNFQVQTYEDVSNILEELYDRHVARETDFRDWNHMLDTAKKEYNPS
ncbi:hypothetical protein [Paenibacillus lemnae]|uniref:Uncharacterized protein n=1 Tax=Paenibacillus lemnae TaxID=1330551 RepID=A0A848M3C1_PAELE|nr:hypothetical protein [Paenibacillus lemnae]NMO95076.1 hypothetical protein [Paenibacillus lemnae]